MKQCMNSRCKAQYENGVEVNIKYFRGLRQIETTISLDACSLECGFAAQSEHGEKSQIEGKVLAGQALQYTAMATAAKRYGGMRS